MIVAALRTLAALCLLGAAALVFLAVPGPTAHEWDATLRRVVEVTPGWNQALLAQAATSLAAAVLWCAIAEALDLLAQIRDRLDRREK